jgi:outer membrane protein TolC
MRKVQYIAIVTLMAFCLSFSLPVYTMAADPPVNELTIQEALDKAYKNNPDLRKARLKVEETELLKEDMADMVDFIPAGGLVLPKVQQVVNGYQMAEIGWKTAKKAAQTTKDKVTMDVVAAYADAITNYNSTEIARLEVQEAHQQMKMRSVANKVGMLDDFSYQMLETNTKRLEEEYNLAKSQYDGSIATLRSLLGENENWQPTLTSRATLVNYDRADLSLELSRGLNQAVDVYLAEAELEMEKSREKWIIPGVSSDQQSVNTGLKEVEYEKAKRDNKASIQQLYYGIDALQGKIAATQMAYDTAKRDRELAEIKYEVGLIPYASIAPDGESLLATRKVEEKARMGLEITKATLAKYKAQFACLTGQKVYESQDWINGDEATAVEDEVNNK